MNYFIKLKSQMFSLKVCATALLSYVFLGFYSHSIRVISPREHFIYLVSFTCVTIAVDARKYLRKLPQTVPRIIQLMTHDGLYKVLEFH
jgi:hypothetical protein